MSNFSKILLGAAVCAASTVAFASGDSYGRGTEPFIKGGWSIGIDGGYGYISSPEANYPNDYHFDDAYIYSSFADVGDWVWGAHIARDFKVSTNLLMGMELGYKYLGSNDHGYSYQSTEDDDFFFFEGSRSYQQNAVDFLLTAHYYLCHGLNIFGKAGVAYVNSDVSQHAHSDTDAEQVDIALSALEGDNDIWRLEPEFSLGVGYTFKNHIDIHAAYTYIGGANDQPIVNYSPFENDSMFQAKAKVYSTNMVMAGISYTF